MPGRTKPKRYEKGRTSTMAATSDTTESMELMPNKEACTLFGLWTTAELGYAIHTKQLPIGIAIPPGENGKAHWKVRVYRRRAEKYRETLDMVMEIQTGGLVK